MTEEYSEIKIYREDREFIDYIAEEIKRPRAEIIRLMTSLLALAILRPDEIYRLYAEVVKDGEEA